MSREGAGTNRLAEESSPYLRLHAHNPVDWYPWGEEALARARAEDRPIFLSVGYSTCYWCHVMERESFSDPAIAERMNADFVNIKVDREERPELDEIYMVATQILTGHGGWPNSVFLTPQLEPFFAGTYFPPSDRQGLPGFPRVLHSLSEAWRNRRGEVAAQAEELERAMRGYLEERTAGSGALPGAAPAGRSLADLERRFDPRLGGFGGAPKFPTPSNLFLLAELAGESPRAGEMLAVTLDRMARGGLRDHLGGGFHRYATDAEWKIPHFEKMLYDNGFLLELYAREWRRTADPAMAEVARATAAWLEGEMRSPEGAFWSAQDAETGGREGAFYVWSRDELRAVLGEEDFGFLAPLFGFDGPPFFEGGEYVLHLPEPLAAAAARRQLSREALAAQIEPLRARLLEARRTRQRPATDDKILADWNGIAIAGLAVAGRLLPEPRLVALAEGAAELVLGTMRDGAGTLLHAWRDGRGRVTAFLGDYTLMARGLLALHEATDGARWLEAATELTEQQVARLADPQGGFYVAAESPDVRFRSREVFDGATPSANSIAVLNLIELAERRAEPRWRALAEAALRRFSGVVDRTPEAARMLALAARRFERSAGAGGGTAGAGPAGAAAAAGEPAAPLRLDLALSAPAADGWRPFALTVTLEPGWHVYAPSGDDAATPVQPIALAGAGLELRALALPPGVRESAGEPRLYRHRVVLRGELRAAGEWTGEGAAGGGGRRLELSYQACDDRRCLAPATAAVPVPLEAAGPVAGGGG